MVQSPNSLEIYLLTYATGWDVKYILYETERLEAWIEARLGTLDFPVYDYTVVAFHDIYINSEGTAADQEKYNRAMAIWRLRELVFAGLKYCIDRIPVHRFFWGLYTSLKFIVKQ